MARTSPRSSGYKMGTYPGQDIITSPSALIPTPTPTCHGTSETCQFTQCTYLWDAGGNWSTRRKPIQTWGEHADSTQTVLWPGIDFHFFLISVTTKRYRTNQRYLKTCCIYKNTWCSLVCPVICLKAYNINLSNLYIVHS